MYTYKDSLWDLVTDSRSWHLLAASGIAVWIFKTALQVEAGLPITMGNSMSELLMMARAKPLALLVFYGLLYVLGWLLGARWVREYQTAYHITIPPIIRPPVRFDPISIPAFNVGQTLNKAIDEL